MKKKSFSLYLQIIFSMKVGLAESWSFPMEEDHNVRNRLYLMRCYLGLVDFSSIHMLIMVFMCR